MNTTYLAFVFFLIFSFNLEGQSSRSSSDPLSSLQRDSLSNYTTHLTLDEGIEENYYKHITQNRKNPSVIGYRIRIFSGSGHDAQQKATQARGRFLSKYPEIGAYLRYDSPDYKVYVGDCRTRSEVLKLFNQIKREFPYAFIPPKQAIDPKKYKPTVEYD